MSHLDPIVDKIIVARVGLLLRHPFFGNMATRLKIVDASDWVTTVATDGRHLYYNRDFLKDLTNKEVEFCVGHEILHNVFEHMLRAESRNHRIWNIACDYAVNGQLTRDKIGNAPSKIKIYHDTKHYGKSAEQIYDEIFEKHDEEELASLGSLLDQHIDWEDNKNNPNQPTYSKEELRQIRDEIKEAMLQAAQAAGAGNTPAEIARMIKEITEPKMNWRELLRQQIQSVIRSDYTWMRPSRKAWHLRAILPGASFRETIDICIAIDMSGSISNQQAGDFISEIKGIMDEYQDYKIKLWCFDTKVYNEEDFDGQGGNDLMEYQVKGGGGTDFDCNWEYMKEHDINPKKFIMFTDGYPWGSWGDENYCDTVFIIHGNNTIVPPFGAHAYYDFTK